MNNYTDYQNCLLNRLAYVNFNYDVEPGTSLSECIPDKYASLREEIEAAGLGHLQITDYVNNNDIGTRSGFCAVAFKDPDTNAVGVSYRGTENLNALLTENQVDMADNIHTAVLGLSAQQQEALAFFENNMNSSGDNYIFGHSKGGELASEVYAVYHKKIKEVHLYNPQPINSYKLTDEQKEAFKSDKVDVIIIDGDFVSRMGDKSVFGDRIRYMECNALEDGLFYSHLLDAASFDSNGNAIIEHHPYEKYVLQNILGNLCETLVLSAADIIHNPLGLIKDLVMNTEETLVLVTLTVVVLAISVIYQCISLSPITLEKFYIFVDNVFEVFSKIGEKLDEIKQLVCDFFEDVQQVLTEWFLNTFNASYRYASDNPWITVDTGSLRTYAERIAKVNSRITKLDVRLDTLYTKVGLVDLWNLLQADALTGESWRLTKCVNYLRETAEEFEAVEREISGGI